MPLPALRLPALAALLALASPLLAVPANQFESQLLSLQKALDVEKPADGRNAVTALELTTCISQGNYGQAHAILGALADAATTDSTKALIKAVDQSLYEKEAGEAKEADTLLGPVEANVRTLFEANAAAASFDPILKQLAEIADKHGIHATGMYDGALGASPFAVRLAQLRSFVTLWQDYDAHQDGGQMNNQDLLQLSTLLSTYPIVPRSELLKIENDRGTRAKAAAAAAEAQLAPLQAKLVQAIDSAKDPSDLDAILTELTVPNDPYNPGRTYGSGKIESFRRFVLSWQDYLAQEKAGDHARAMQTLSGLNQYQNEVVYPRSKILALMYKAPEGGAEPPGSSATYQVHSRPLQPSVPGTPVPAASPLPAPSKVSVDTLDEFAAAVASQPPGSLPNSQLAFVVPHLVNARHFIREGEGESALVELQNARSNNRSGDYQEVIERICGELARKALPLCAATGKAPLGPDESMKEYFTRIASGARDAGHWDQALQVLRLARGNGLVGAFNLDVFSADIEGYSRFFAGANMEAAGLWPEAVASYRAALRSGGQLIPSVEIGVRLKRIKEEHPDDYAKGETLPENPVNFQGGMNRLRPGP